MSKYDVIVIGGGHNGLTAATTLATKGKKVLLLEQNERLGGIAAGRELQNDLFTNGLLHDTSCVRSEIVDKLNLQDHGLHIYKQRPKTALLSKNGQSIILSDDLNATVSEISKFSKSDGTAYVEYREFINKISPFLSSFLNEIPPDLIKFDTRELIALGKLGWKLKRLGKNTMNEFLKVAPMCVADFLNEKFETDFLKAGLCAPAIYGSFTGPWSSYTNLNLLIYECLSKVHIKGGSQNLIQALEKAAKSIGVTIQNSQRVKRIQLDQNGKVRGVVTHNDTSYSAPIVLSSCTPKETFLNLLSPGEIDYPLEHEITHFRSRGTTAKLNIALTGNIRSRSTEQLFEFARTGNSFDEMEKAFDAVKYGRYSDEPILDIHIPESSDSEARVLSLLVHFVPYQLKEGWSDISRQQLENKIMSTMDSYLDLSDCTMEHKELLSPVDLEQQYGLTHGNIFHGEHAVDQLLTRPVPRCARYDTPIKGLFLGGSGSHPGGGITCAPGYLSAQRILKF